MHCSNCGTEVLRSDQRLCAKCGKPIRAPYAPSDASRERLNLQESEDPPYAGFWRRVAGYLIDYVVVVVIYVCLVVMLRVIGSGSQIAPLVFPLYVIAAWIYSAGLESSAKQATLGKLAVGIKVTDLDGRRIGFGRATGRYFAHIVTVLTIGVGYAVAVFSRKRQTVHDMIADTLVVRDEFSSEQIAEAGPAPRVPVYVSALSIIAIVLLGPFGLGLLAAIAIPAYQNYTIRAQVTEGLMAAEAYKAAVAEAYGQGQPFNRITSENLSIDAKADLKYVESLQVISGVVVITYGHSANKLIAQKTISLAPGVDNEKNLVWSCGYHSSEIPLEPTVRDASKYTTVAPQYLPTLCRQGP